MVTSDEQWCVSVDAFTKFVAPDYVGYSCDPLVRQDRLPALREAVKQVLKNDFSLGVVLVPCGSGKTSLLRLLQEHHEMNREAYEVDVHASDAAVCSHPGFIGPDGDLEAVARLSCVGLNRIPAWLRPFSMLSNGEASRVELALSLRNGACIDNFAAVVDNHHASSMATSLSRFLRRHSLRNVLVATSKAACLPFLAPDFVILAETGNLVPNPIPVGTNRQPIVSFDFRGLSNFCLIAGSAGWREGELDEDPVSWEWTSESLAGAHVTVIEGAGEQTELCCSVRNDAACQEAANAFEYEFTGETKTQLNVLPRAAACTPPLQGTCLGAVLGPSGCGKSTTLASWGEIKPVIWESNKAVISHFADLGMSPEEAAELLEAVALPKRCWLCPHFVLSSGEQHQCDVARGLHLGGPVDEFTSVHDRDTAKKMCRGVSAYIRRHNARYMQNPVVVATVHDDISCWLRPDWIWDAKRGLLVILNHSSCEEKAQEDKQVRFGVEADTVLNLFHPPQLNFHIRRLAGNFDRIKDVWKGRFSEHHYLTGGLPSCVFPLLVRTTDGTPVAFHASSVLPGGFNGGITLREARMVVLPEFQGLGLGPKLSDAVAQHFLDEGYRYYSVTAHPSLGERRQASHLWRPVDGNMVSQIGKSWKKRASCSKDGPTSKKVRTCYRHQYMGPCGHGNDHLLPLSKQRRQVVEETSCAECALALRVGAYILQQGCIMPSAVCSVFSDSVDLAFLERHFMFNVVVPEAIRTKVMATQETPTVDDTEECRIFMDSFLTEDSETMGTPMTSTLPEVPNDEDTSLTDECVDQSLAAPSTGGCLECSVASLIAAHLRGIGGAAKLNSLCSKFPLQVLQKTFPSVSFGVGKSFLQRHFDVLDGQVTLPDGVISPTKPQDLIVAPSGEQDGHFDVLDGQVTLHDGLMSQTKPQDPIVATSDEQDVTIAIEAAKLRGACKLCGIAEFIRSSGGHVRRRQVEEVYGGKYADIDFMRKHFHVSKSGLWSVRDGECSECTFAVKVADHLQKQGGSMQLTSLYNSKFDGSRPTKEFLTRWFFVDSHHGLVVLYKVGSDVTESQLEGNLGLLTAAGTCEHSSLDEHMNLGAEDGDSSTGMSLMRAVAKAKSKNDARISMQIDLNGVGR